MYPGPIRSYTGEYDIFRACHVAPFPSRTGGVSDPGQRAMICAPSMGHLTERAQAFLSALISAGLLSRAIYGISNA